MKITECRVYPIGNKNRLRAYATIVFNDAFVVRDLKIIGGDDGLFVAMPNKKCKDGTYKDIAHPLNQETRRLIEDTVLGEFEKFIETAHKSISEKSQNEMILEQ
ncbi:MAG: septation regulator SpoVG [Nitrospinae bacterium]|nr:septation regulator SpoVG [Nitrospinota bacterium]